MTAVEDILRSRRSVPMIRQSEGAECGLACLAMVANFYGHKTDLGSLRRRFSLSLKGANLKTLISISDRMGLIGRALKVPMEALDQLSLPAILHWDLNHFVVLVSIGRKGVVIHDPARGRRQLDWDTLSAHFTGIALELSPAQNFERKKEAERLKLSQLWSKLIGFKRSLTQLIVLSLILQAFVLVSPFYSQLVIDEVLVKSDTSLLLVLAIGFGLFTLINAATEALRGHVLLYAGSLMSHQMVSNLFRHMIALPQSFFDKRHMGDIVSRFGSAQPIRQMLTEGLVSALIDGIMAITTLILMFVYSPLLAMIVLSALTLLIALRIGFYRTLRRRSEEAILTKAEENSNFMETVRGMLPIKLYGREQDRQQLWQNRFADTVNADVRVGRTNIWFTLFNTLIFGLENVLVIYVAATIIIGGGFSVGMLFAFMSYKTQFVDKARALVDRAIEFRMLDLHLERLADIALSDPEPREDAMVPPAPLEGAIELRDVRFSYAEGEPDVIRDFNLVIEPGQSVALTGQSGCGKTTLVKILLGLLEPQKGEILIDGKSLKQYGRRAFRSQLGAVMQDDQLFAGSLSDNIAFYDPEPDQARIIECAEAAAVHEDIMAMPMQYETLVGDMGTVLSGGQKQRVLLARALYRRPRMLVLDEGTAHLDTGTEARVNAAVKSMGITRIIVAHRPETILSADRVLVMFNGQIVDDKPPGSLLKGLARSQLA